MTGRDKIANLLGLAYRARKVVCGDFAAENHLRKHRVPMLFVASDGKDNAVKYKRLAQQKGMTVVDIFTKEELGGAVGKGQNVIILLTDSGFAKAIEKVLHTM